MCVYAVSTTGIVFFILTCVALYLYFCKRTLPEPDVEFSEFSEHFARELFGITATTYDSDDTSIKPEVSCVANSLPGFDILPDYTKVIKCDDDERTCAFVTAAFGNERKLIIAFRGTSSLSQLLAQGVGHLLNPHPVDLNWIEPSSVLSESITQGRQERVNEYFNKTSGELWANGIRDLLKQYKGFKVTFTGHSLGGALATLTALRAVVSGLFTSEQVRVYSFGAPRIGDYLYAKFQDYHLPRSYRIVNGDDIVAHLPPCASYSSWLSKLKEWCVGRALADLTLSDMACAGAESAYYHGGTEHWYPGSRCLLCAPWNVPNTHRPRMQDPWLSAVDGKSVILVRGNRAQLQNDSQLPHYVVGCGDADDSTSSKCSSTVVIPSMHRFFYDHVNYFGHWVSKFGQLGCRLDAKAAAKENEEGAKEEEMLEENLEQLVEKGCVKGAF